MTPDEVSLLRISCLADLFVAAVSLRYLLSSKACCAFLQSSYPAVEGSARVPCFVLQIVHAARKLLGSLQLAFETFTRPAEFPSNYFISASP